MNASLSGGCQCGAVRYRVTGTPETPHLCHCRMCQKASGNYFLPLAWAPGDTLTITRGQPSWFHSSDPVRRGFCGNCGTPLFFDTLDSKGMAFTLGSLDDPAALPPEMNDGEAGRVPFFHRLGDLGSKEVDRDALSPVIDATNHQHPDRDTESWEAKR
ncbi:MAG: GFA family protein [Rhizobiales bacterium]|nr:GFA family protein [Hyphomicrobiales bacterium]MBO6698710.1 GFA family protein [Hyphomicrobiales bacterium]MBO6735037.1 GFA family protein [Hyphomicrobiales bacterium]MBO6911157.1 GFA family protein [Hyphomicrobiales bacterium]MBO6955667.1 GFA family protein [Hyphomicrobiales bacterium]